MNVIHFVSICYKSYFSLFLRQHALIQLEQQQYNTSYTLTINNLSQFLNKFLCIVLSRIIFKCTFKCKGVF